MRHRRAGFCGRGGKREARQHKHKNECVRTYIINFVMYFKNKFVSTVITFWYSLRVKWVSVYFCYTRERHCMLYIISGRRVRAATTYRHEPLGCGVNVLHSCPTR